MLLAPAGGIATLAVSLLVPRLRVRHARRHRQQAAMRERTRQAQRLAAEWPLLAQTLGLGCRDQWTRQHRFPTAEFVADDQGVTATVAAIVGAGLTDYQRAATYLADTWAASSSGPSNRDRDLSGYGDCTGIRDNCQVAISCATRTVDGAVAALGEEIRQHPDVSSVLLNDPAYVGVAVTSLPGRPGFHRERTPPGRPPPGRRHHPRHRWAAR
jgi:hypothetical protein